MALTKTLAQLRTSLLRRAGIDTATVSASLTPDILNEIINDAIYEGWDVIVGKWLDYFTKSATVPVVAGTDSYAVPTDFFKLRVLWNLIGSEACRMLPIDLDAAHRYVGRSVGTASAYRYRLQERNIIIAPVPSSVLTLTLYYVPIKLEMVNDTDTITFDVPVELKYILALAWRDLLDLQNLDPSPAIAKVQQYEAKLRTSADNRDAGQPFYLDPNGPSGDLDDDEVY